MKKDKKYIKGIYYVKSHSKKNKRLEEISMIFMFNKLPRIQPALLQFQ